MSKQGLELTLSQQIYADLMDEARLRLHAMRDGIETRNSWVPRLLQEFLYLQLRMLCEIIAVCCLVVHDKKNAKVLKSWDMPDIFKQLEVLNPDFYPRGVRFRRLPEGGSTFDEYDAPQMSKAELVKLWQRSGDFLHRGSARNVISEKEKILTVDLDTVIQQGQKILHLLEQHVISSANKKVHLLVALAADEAGGNSMVWVATAP